MTTGAAPRFSADRLRAALGTRRSTAPPSVETHRYSALAANCPGEEVQTKVGPCYVAQWSFPLEHRHGDVSLADVLALDARGVACLTRQPGHAAPRNPVYLDTETTGLSGGVGTYAFLIGLGSIEGKRVVVRQYLMRDYDEEPALLEAVSAQLAQHDAVVTYNGKSFDIPLVETRFIAARRSHAPVPELHLDLLHPARRLLRGSLERCALGDVERTILRHHRQEDVPSWMIPSIYFSYLRDGDARLLGGVLEHNRDDILSLIAFAGWLGKVFSAPQEAALPSMVLTRVAATYESLGWVDDAMIALEYAISSATNGGHRAEAALQLARLLRATGAGSMAEKMWRVAAEHSALAIEALVAWAKYLEHEQRDYDGARAAVERALTHLQLDARRKLNTEPDPRRQALEHRLARIVRRRIRQRP
ncbi:MAG: ribonuclease H-like domain-containing protein [Chloroflexota bacterium]